MFLFFLWVDDIAPVQIAPAETLHEHLGGGDVGSEGNAVLVAQAGDGVGQLAFAVQVGAVGMLIRLIAHALDGGDYGHGDIGIQLIDALEEDTVLNVEF